MRLQTKAIQQVMWKKCQEHTDRDIWDVIDYTNGCRAFKDAAVLMPNMSQILTISMERAEPGRIQKHNNEQMSEFCSVADYNKKEKETHASRICYPWINDGTGAALFPYWDMNQISTRSSLEVRASISLTGHLVPEHGHQGVSVTTLIVMSASSSTCRTRAASP